jgi:hypothetical protein
MLIIEIYAKYKILPFLQLHQLRVAAVTKQICDNTDSVVDTEGAIVAALLHDMGNILKFDLSYFPEMLQPEGADYWKSVQEEYRAKYGDDEHVATLKMAEELGVSKKVQGYMKAVGFRNILTTLEDPSLEKKICCYADQRVAPFGVVSIKQRLEEGGKRYAKHTNTDQSKSHQNRSSDGLYELEHQIFGQSSIKPGDITDESIAPLLDSLRTTNI